MFSLRTVLRTNAGFSLLSGAVLALGSTVLDDILGVPAVWLAALGIGVAAFGVVVHRLSATDPVSRTAAGFVIAADLAWVVGTAVVLVGFPDLLTTAGAWTFGVVGLAVLDFAVLQALGLRQAT